MTDRMSAVGKREAILAAAYKVLDARGYAAATVDQIAAEAGVAKGSIYNYFHGKQDVFMELFTEQLSGDEAEVDRLVAAGISAVEKIEKYMDLWFTRAGEYQRIGALTLEFWAAAARGAGSGRMNEMFLDTYERWRGKIAAIIAQGVASGEFRANIEPLRAAAFIMAAMDGLTVHAIMGIGTTMDEAFLTAMKRGMVLALAADAAQDVTGDTKEEADEW